MTNSYASAASDYAPRGGGHSPRDRVGVPAWLGSLYETDGAAQRYLLLMRFGVFNLVALALVAAAWLKGWVELVLQGDSIQLVLIIALVFAYGLVSCGFKILSTSREINQAREPGRYPGTAVTEYIDRVRGRDAHARSTCASALKLKLASRIASVRHIANSLVFLGLIGTVIGFIIALSGVNAEAAADVSSIGPMVSTLITGMSIALHTTLIGAILNIWLMINYRLLESGTVTLVTAMVEQGEQHAKP
ncbi:MAG: MotA/TolQ/ExbB proton channel family protein [Pseudomonadota bacterium]